MNSDAEQQFERAIGLQNILSMIYDMSAYFKRAYELADKTLEIVNNWSTCKQIGELKRLEIETRNVYENVEEVLSTKIFQDFLAKDENQQYRGTCISMRNNMQIVLESIRIHLEFSCAVPIITRYFFDYSNKF